MKMPIILMLLLLLMIGCSSNKTTNQNSALPVAVVKQVKETEKIIEVIPVDLNNDGKTDTIKLTMPTDYGDPGLFARAYVSIAGSKTTLFNGHEGWDKVDTGFLRKNVNLVKSENVFVCKIGKTAYILLFGYVFGAGREEFTIIQVKSDVPKMIYDGEMQWPQGFEDINHDGKMEFVGDPSSSEAYQHIDSLDADICTYDPTMVYDIDNGLKVNNELTKKYNQEHYVWAEPSDGPDVKVLVPRHGKPRIVK